MLAQSVERPPHNREVVGSIPGRVIPKDIKRWELLLPCFGVQHLKGIEQRRSGAAQWLPGPRSIGQKDFPFRTIKSLLLLLLLSEATKAMASEVPLIGLEQCPLKNHHLALDIFMPFPYLPIFADLRMCPQKKGLHLKL